MATFCFDARVALVWLDPLDPERGPGAGVLCQEHADALTAPRGWHLRDRRGPALRLWDDRPPPVEPRPSRPRTPTRAAAARTSRASRAVLDIEVALDVRDTGLLARAFSRVNGA